MKTLKSLVVGIISVVSVCSAFASSSAAPMVYSNQTQSYVGAFAEFGPSVLSDGVDVYSFTLPSSAATGIYHIISSFGGIGIDIDWSRTNINGVTGSPIMNSYGVDFGQVTVNSESPFILSIYGSKHGFFQAMGGYVDASYVSAIPAVPEPLSSSMMIAGLLMIGMIARRKLVKS